MTIRDFFFYIASRKFTCSFYVQKKQKILIIFKYVIKDFFILTAQMISFKFLVVLSSLLLHRNPFTIINDQ